MKKQITGWVILVGLVTILAVSTSAFSQEKKQGEKLDVESVKKKYWAQGNESEMSVVQNRLYSKQGKVEFEPFVASMAGDPFIDMKSVGANLAYHFSETWAINAVAWKTFPAFNNATKAFVTEAGFEPNSNFPRLFYGGDVMYSPIYGKLSLIGKVIIYYDLHLMLGAGQIKTDNGDYFAPTFGIGQQVYLSKNFALRLDYRLLYFTETIIDHRDRHVVGPRVNWTDTLNIGISVLIP